jgi:hypothetical protein
VISRSRIAEHPENERVSKRKVEFRTAAAQEPSLSDLPVRARTLLPQLPPGPEKVLISREVPFLQGPSVQL